MIIQDKIMLSLYGTGNPVRYSQSGSALDRHLNSADTRADPRTYTAHDIRDIEQADNKTTIDELC